MHLGEHLAEELKALDMCAARRGSKLGESQIKQRTESSPVPDASAAHSG
jgi:hypothetical protein